MIRRVVLTILMIAAVLSVFAYGLAQHRWSQGRPILDTMPHILADRFWPDRNNIPIRDARPSPSFGRNGLCNVFDL